MRHALGFRCSKRNQQQFHNQYHTEKEMADNLLDCLKEGPKFTTGIPEHLDSDNNETQISFGDLPLEVQNELIQNTFERRRTPQNDAVPPTHVEAAPPAPASPPAPPAPSPSVVASTSSTAPGTKQLSPIPPPSSSSGEINDPLKALLKKALQEPEANDPLKAMLKKSQQNSEGKHSLLDIFKKPHQEPQANDPLKAMLKKSLQGNDSSTSSTKVPPTHEQSPVRSSLLSFFGKRPASTTAAPVPAPSPISGENNDPLKALLAKSQPEKVSKAPPTNAATKAPTVPTLPALPTLPPPEKAWNDLVHLLFPTLASTTVAPTTTTTQQVTTEDPVKFAAKARENEIMNRKMEFLNKFYCSEYIRCAQSVAEARTKCEKEHLGDAGQYGIANTKLRERLLRNSKSAKNGVKVACMAFINDQSVKDYSHYESEASLVDNKCVTESPAVLLTMSVIEHCDATVHVNLKNETEEAAADLETCLQRVDEQERRCLAIRDCCPQTDTCAQKQSPGPKEKLSMFHKQIDAEQKQCESALEETVVTHQRNLERFKFRYLSL